jgi:hypothetical protein
VERHVYLIIWLVLNIFEIIKKNIVWRNVMYKFMLISMLLLILHPIYAQSKSGEAGRKHDSLITTGSYVKVHAPSKAIKWTSRGRPIPIKGTVKAIHADTIILEIDDLSDPMSIPIDVIKKLEIPAGKASIIKILMGGCLGLLGGIAIGSIFSSANSEMDAIAAFYISCGAGLIAGLILGGIIPPYDHWKEVPLNRIKIGLSQLRDNGLRLEVSFTF